MEKGKAAAPSQNAFTPPAERCEVCRFYSAPPKEAPAAVLGECKRLPPTPQIVTVMNPNKVLAANEAASVQTVASIRAPVSLLEWCGEFSPNVTQ